MAGEGLDCRHFSKSLNVISATCNGDRGDGVKSQSVPSRCKTLGTTLCYYIDTWACREILVDLCCPAVSSKDWPCPDAVIPTMNRVSVRMLTEYTGGWFMPLLPLDKLITHLAINAVNHEA